MTIDEFLKLAKDSPKKACSYDFREEIMAFDGAKDGLERHIIYKAVGIAEKDNDDVRRGKKTDGWVGYEPTQAIYNKRKGTIYIPGGEADCCDLLQKIFQRLWKDKLPKGTVGGDTMNSIQMTINRLLGTWSARELEERYAKDQAAVTEKVVGAAGAEDFLTYAYTVGNFIPCPAGCNRPATSVTKDYWDLTLYYIYCWYHDTPERRDCHLEKLFWGDKYQNQHIENYKVWLGHFQSWDAFIEANYLQDYTEWSAKPYGRPREFWNEHFSSLALPQTKEEIEAFFKRATECIRVRSRRIVEALAAEGGKPETAN